MIVGSLGRVCHAHRVLGHLAVVDPIGSVEGFNRLSFGLRVAHFDPPPPEVLGDLNELEATNRFRFVNRLEAWIEIQDGRIVDAGQSGGGRINVTRVGYGPASITFTPVPFDDLRPGPEIGPTSARFLQTTGGRTGFPTPRRVRHEPYIQIEAPVVWTTLALTIHTSGTAGYRLMGSSSFLGTGFTTTAVGWSPRAALSTTTPGGGRHSAPHTPWGDEDSAPIMAAAESARASCR